jgi:hypothetical protein
MTSSFNSYPRCYGAWFSRREAAHLSELLAVRALLPNFLFRFMLFLIVFLFSKFYEKRFRSFSKFDCMAKLSSSVRKVNQLNF